jgi:hypothetical protein
MAIRFVSLYFVDSVYSVTFVIQDGERPEPALEDTDDEARYARRSGIG